MVAFFSLHDLTYQLVKKWLSISSAINCFSKFDNVKLNFRDIGINAFQQFTKIAQAILNVCIHFVYFIKFFS